MMIHLVYVIGSCVQAECARSKVLRTVSNGGWTPQHQHTATTLHLLTTAFSGLPGPLTPDLVYIQVISINHGVLQEIVPMWCSSILKSHSRAWHWKECWSSIINRLQGNIRQGY